MKASVAIILHHPTYATTEPEQIENYTFHRDYFFRTIMLMLTNIGMNKKSINFYEL